MRTTVFRARVLGVLYALCAALLFAPPAAAETKSADDVLAMVDAVVFHPDRQEGLNGYSATVTETRGDDTENSAKGRVDVDSLKRGRVFTLDGGETRALGAFLPSGGFWDLSAVMQVETTLFSTPLAEQFPADEYERFVARRAGGFALRLKPKTAIGTASMFHPSVTSISLHVGPDGRLLTGELGLDMELMKATAKLEFTFEEVDGKQRIAGIANTIASTQIANLRVTPAVVFAYTEVEGMELVESISVTVDASEISNTLGTLVESMTSRQAFSNYRVLLATPPVPDDWSGVTAWYLRRMLGEALPGDEIAALLPSPAKPSKERKVGASRRRMYLAHGLRLTFDAGDVLTEALIRVKPGNGFAAFAGELGDGLSTDSTRASVEEAFGKPASSKSASKTTTVSYPGHGLDVVYEGKKAGATAAVVAIVLRPKTEPESDE